MQGAKQVLAKEPAEHSKLLERLMSNGGLEASKQLYAEFLDPAIRLFRSEPSVIEISSRKAVIVGDLHGDVDTFKKIARLYPPRKHQYILMGDYVDRSNTSTELLALLLTHKLRYGNNFVMIRGDHESPLGEVSKQTFPHELYDKLGRDLALVNKVYGQLFTELPMAVVLNKEYFIVHGGIPISCPTLGEIKAQGKVAIPRQNNQIYQMIWNDPSTQKGVSFNERSYDGDIHKFGPDLADNFLAKNGLKMIIRGHDHSFGGFFMIGNTLTLLSTTAYPGDKPYVAQLSGEQLIVYDISGNKPAIDPYYHYSRLRR
ncbi:MAG: metallophosphoesterase [Candidatus Micrarchaeota archaeon]|nr:metallophosphoesterase [Candidatus Micrarchaeota archaeon]